MDKYESAKILWKYTRTHPCCYPCQGDWLKFGILKSEYLFEFSEKNARIIRKHSRGEYNKI